MKRIRRRLADRNRGDEGNLILVLILILALAATGATAIAVVIPSFSVASTSQAGEQAVAQADAGLSDGMFRLDQMGDQTSSMCVGDPPSAYLPTALDGSTMLATQCVGYNTSGIPPLPGAPGLQWYVIQDLVAPSEATGGNTLVQVTQEVQITAQAKVSGQVRTVTANMYRVANSYGLFSVSGITLNGNSGKATVVETSGYPSNAQIDGGLVNFGVGPGSTFTCNGGKGGTNGGFTTVIQSGGSISGACPNQMPQTTSFTAKPPTQCASAQTLSTAFAPCVYTGSFAEYSGKTYCPLPGSGWSNPIPTSTTIYGTSQAPADGATFDCQGSPAGAAATITTDSSLPYGFPAIPPGNYYFDSDNVTIGNMAPADFIGPVNLFVLPEACGADGSLCAPPANSAACTLGSPSATTSLNLSSSSINVTPAFKPVQPYTGAGDPSNLNIYWSGAASMGAQNGNMAAQIYAPNADFTGHGSKDAIIYGSAVFNCYNVNGAPNLIFVYPEHAAQFLQNWTVANYKISY